MTICIAVLCDEGRSVVVAADRMVSAPFLTVEFDHPNAKIDEIGPRCVALSAGDVLSLTDILSESSGISGQLSNPAIRLITEEIKQRFVDVRRRLLNERVFQPRGLSFEDYYTRGIIGSIPPDLAMMLDNQVQGFQLGVSLIVAGVDSSDGHIYLVDDPGTSQCFDRLGYHAIGSGSRHAMLSLVTLQHSINVDLKRALYNVYCAKRQAEIAPGVGPSTDMLIIGSKGTRKVEDETLKCLAELFEGRSSSPPNLDSLRDRPHSKGVADEDQRQSEA